MSTYEITTTFIGRGPLTDRAMITATVLTPAGLRLERHIFDHRTDEATNHHLAARAMLRHLPGALEILASEQADRDTVIHTAGDAR